MIEMKTMKRWLFIRVMIVYYGGGGGDDEEEEGLLVMVTVMHQTAAVYAAVAAVLTEDRLQQQVRRGMCRSPRLEADLQLHLNQSGDFSCVHECACL